MSTKRLINFHWKIDMYNERVVGQDRSQESYVEWCDVCDVFHLEQFLSFFKYTFMYENELLSFHLILQKLTD